MGRRHRRKGQERAIARRRIEHLFELARRRLRDDADGVDPEGARRATHLGRRIAMRYQTGLPVGLRDRICRSCTEPLVPGRTARIRVETGAVRTTCLGCGATQRRPYIREQKARRADRAHARGDAPAPSPATPAPVAPEVEA